MEIQQLPIAGLLLVKPRVFGDSRGSFSETWNQTLFNEAVGSEVQFVQANESRSSRGVLRGLHFQAPPHAQGKLVRVVSGSVLDVAVDLRKGSPTYGQHHAVRLSGEEGWQYWIPPGFGHGFLALEDHTIFHYLCTGLYEPTFEGSLRWNDPDLAIDWGTTSPSLSAKDEAAPGFLDFQSPF
jgi:dTDP-4-dehydrorhamnose 3,5-epimerase